MADGIEMIESRLAAYIDGELGDADRAEIEKYLAANPSHRQLIEELKRQKLTIASLPRESAPVEVLDHLQSHLERQALLDNVEDGADSMRINRWPQWTAVAAMLLLTVGLGALVFSVLPGGALNHETIAIAPPSMQNLPTAPSLDTKEADVESRDAVASAAAKRADDEERFSKSAGKPGAGGNDAFAANDKLEDVLNPSPTAQMPAPLNVSAGGAKIGDRTLALNNGSAIVVSTDDPLITQNLLAGYLGQNNYEYTPVRAELARASFATMQSNSVAGAPVLEGANTQELQPATQAKSDLTQQALGSVVERVNAKDKVAADAEQYLLVRNVTPADAERINRIINSQRGARQQARFYDNTDLYPEVAQQNQAYRENKLQQQAKPAEQAGAPSPADADTGNPLQARRDRAAKAGLDQTGDVQRQADITETPATQPAGQEQKELGEMIQRAEPEQAMRTDVLIVVRSDLAIDPPGATQPATQPAAEPPATQPTVEPNAPVQQILPADQPLQIDIQFNTGNEPIRLPPETPATQPATQPAP